MPLVRKIITVYLDDPEAPEGYTEHQVQVRTADQLLAEQKFNEIPGAANATGATVSTLWAWAAMKREGKFAGKFQDFVTRCIDTDIVTGEESAVDPTPPGPSDDSS